MGLWISNQIGGVHGMVYWVTSGTQQKIFPIMTECEFRGKEENKKHKRDARKLERTSRGRCEIEKRRGGRDGCGSFQRTPQACLKLMARGGEY